MLVVVFTLRGIGSENEGSGFASVFIIRDIPSRRGSVNKRPAVRVRFSYLAIIHAPSSAVSSVGAAEDLLLMKAGLAPAGLALFKSGDLVARWNLGHAKRTFIFTVIHDL